METWCDMIKACGGAPFVCSVTGGLVATALALAASDFILAYWVSGPPPHTYLVHSLTWHYAIVYLYDQCCSFSPQLAHQILVTFNSCHSGSSHTAVMHTAVMLRMVITLPLLSFW